MRIILITVAAYIVVASSLMGCSKNAEAPSNVCTAPDAINYGREGECAYMVDVYKGNYKVRIVSFTGEYSGTLEDKTYPMSFVDGKDICQNGQYAKRYSLSFQEGGDRVLVDSNTKPNCVYVSGSEFYISGMHLKSGWPGNPKIMHGNGVFTKGGFRFTGYIPDQNADTTYVITLEGTK